MRLAAIVVLASSLFAQPQLGFLNRGHPVLDAHNCYPYEGLWADRMDRALGTGFPVGIEQDLAWRIDSNGAGRVVVSHTSETTGKEPTLQQHFFERVRPIVENALRENDRSRWPLIILHFDVKDNRPELHRAVWSLVGECEGWITTARKTADPHELTPFDPKPLLALTEDNGAQENVFFKDVPVGAKLRVFGSAHTNKIPALPTRAGARRRHSSFRGPIRVRPVLRADQCFRTLACVICGRLSLSRLGARQRL